MITPQIWSTDTKVRPRLHESIIHYGSGMSRRSIGIGNSMICSDIWHKYHS